MVPAGPSASGYLYGDNPDRNVGITGPEHWPSGKVDVDRCEAVVSLIPGVEAEKTPATSRDTKKRATDSYI